MLAGLALGARLPEQWGSAAAPIDFYDVKADLQACWRSRRGGEVLASSRQPMCPACIRAAARASCEPVSASACSGSCIQGCSGAGPPQAPLLFELDYAGSFGAEVAQFREISRFPRIRRDISLTVAGADRLRLSARTC